MQDSERDDPSHLLNDGRHRLNGRDKPPHREEPREGQQVQEAAWEDEEAVAVQLPGGRLRNALIAGVILGLLCTAQGILITLANASMYQAVGASPPGKLSASLALTLLGLRVLSLCISVVILVVGGFITGRIVVQRRPCFLAGFVTGVITSGAGFLLSYVPGYPGNLPASGASDVGGIVAGILLSLALILIAGGLAGLFSLFGAWLATRRHPYYMYR